VTCSHISEILRDYFNGKRIGKRLTAKELKRAKVNVSNHRPSADYFDDETAALVADRDWLICDLFRYGLHGSKAA
jgi:hypothetical protein